MSKSTSEPENGVRFVIVVSCFMASIIAIVTGLMTIMLRYHEAASLRSGGWMAAVGLAGTVVFGYLCRDLTLTEEEGRLPNPPPTKEKDAPSGDDSGKRC